MTPLLQGLGGYTRRVRLRAPTGTPRYKTQFLRERVRTKPRQTLRESARTPPEARGLLSGTLERGTLSEQSKGSLKSHQKIKLEGKPWAPHPQRPSPPGPPPRLEPRAGGLGTLTRIPPRARLAMEGLGRGCILRIARGLSRHASARNPISVSREASFSVSLEPGSSAARRPRLDRPSRQHVMSH